jgi:very-short-patch-repair endonuclease
MKKGTQSFGASKEMIRKAKSLRRKQTLSEERLWKILRNGNINGLRFRRQHPLSFYIVDFYCHEIKLVIEVDGDIHRKEEVKKRDEIREAYIRNFGVCVMRFSNEDVYFNSGWIVLKVLEYRKAFESRMAFPYP